MISDSVVSDTDLPLELLLVEDLHCNHGRVLDIATKSCQLRHRFVEVSLTCQSSRSNKGSEFS